MRSSFIALATLGQYVAAYPSVAEAVASDNAAADLEKRQHGDQQGGFPEPIPEFHAAQQYVSTSGKHKFVAPDLSVDSRGPCPGLNAMANHGYLPHNGVGTAHDFIEGTHTAFGMGRDLAGILTTIGQTLDGNGLAWSIGGPNKALPAPAGGLLGTPQGISGSHNKYEADASPGRGDLYKYGNDFTLQMDQFQELYDMGQANGDNYDLVTLREFRSKRYDNSVATNPYFFNGPFSGVLVQPAAYEFIYRFMSNKSEEHPHGHLNGEILKSFFGVTEDKNGKLTQKAGHERFPENWYKRALSSPYSQVLLTADTIAAATVYPKFAAVGGNTGKVNSFKGVNPGKLTGGVFNSQNLLKGNNLACFAMGFQAQATPDLLKCGGVLSDVLGSSSKLTGALTQAMSTLSCPKTAKYDMNQFKQFPGYGKLSCSTGKYPGQ